MSRRANSAVIPLLYAGVAVPCAGARSEHLTFSGQAAQDRIFRKSIGHGLEFALVPDTM